MTYYLKYRPQTLDELDSKEARASLVKILASGNIPHAFLFSGPKGTGKTSAARIVAKMVNCESTSLKLRGPGKIGPCNRCSQCTSVTKGSNIDVLEIDAASNRGIDDIRVLRDSVKLSPARAKKKIYIIDEAHMLTLEASNALLKTLEEPPDHVVFILATTNPEKLIKTIRSRVTEVVFKKAGPEEIKSSLEKIIKGEGLKIDATIIGLIAKNADGSFRDAAKLLEQIVAEEVKDPDEVERRIAGGSGSIVDNLTDLLVKRDSRKVVLLIEDYVSKGLLVEKVVDDLLSRVKESIFAKLGIGEDPISEIDRADLFYLVDLLIKAGEQMAVSLIEQLPLEIALIKWCGERPATEKENTKDKSESNSEGAGEEAGEGIKTTENPGGEISLEEWKKVLAAVRPINTSVEALLRAAKPLRFDGKTLTLGVYYRFHKERLEEDKHRRLLEDIVSEVLSTRTRISCTLTEGPNRMNADNGAEKTVLLQEAEVVKPLMKGALTKDGDEDIIRLAKRMFSN